MQDLKYNKLEVIRDYERLNLVNWLISVTIKTKEGTLNDLGKALLYGVEEKIDEQLVNILDLKIKDIIEPEQLAILNLPNEILEKNIPPIIILYGLLTFVSRVITEYLNDNFDNFVNCVKELTGVNINAKISKFDL